MIIQSTISKVVKQVKTGKTPPTTVKEYFNGEYNWYTPSDLNKKLLSISSRTITNKAYEDKKAVIYPKGTVLLSCIGDIGKVGVTIDETSSSNQQITGLILDDEKITPEYFYYWCIAHKYIFEKSATNAIVPILNNKRLKSIKIWYEEDIREQRKVANLLFKIENLVQKREKSIELLDSLIRSTFLDMFGDPSLNLLKWKVKKFGENIEYIGDIGSNGSNANIAANLEMLDKENYALMVRTVNLNTNDFKKNVKYVSKKTYDYFLKSKIYGGEIIMNKIGSAGQFWIMPNLKRPVSLGLNQLMIKLKDLNTYYLYYYLSTHYGQMNIKSRVKGAVTKSITKTAVKNIPLLYPPKELQDKFADIVIKIEDTKKIYENSLNELKQLFNATSQKAFKGELDLNIVTLKFEDKFPDILDEIVKEEEEKNLHFEENHRKFTKTTVTKIEDGEVHGFSMDAQGFKNLIKNTLACEHTFEELDTKMRSKGWVIPYDEELNKKDKPFTYKDIIFELLKENQIVQEIRGYEEDGELKRKILLKAKK